MKSTPPTRRATAFTLIELLVVIAIIAILAAILFPVFAKAREKARQTACLSNMKQLSLAFLQYAQDNEECLPADGDGGAYGTPGWVPSNAIPKTAPNNSRDIGGSGIPGGAIYPYVKSVQIYLCPSDPDPYRNHLSYSMNLYLGYQQYHTGMGAPFLLARADYSAQTILLIDEQKTLNDGAFQACGDLPSYVHTGGANFCFLDGHARWKNNRQLYIKDYVPSDGFPQQDYNLNAGATPGPSNCVRGPFPINPVTGLPYDPNQPAP